MNSKEFFLTWGMLIIGVIMNVFGIYVVKVKMNILGQVQLSSFGTVFNYFFTLLKSPLALCGVLAVLAAPLPLAIAVSRMELSVAYPAAIAFNFVILVPLSVLFLGESITLGKAAGIGLIVISLYLLHK